MTYLPGSPRSFELTAHRQKQSSYRSIIHKVSRPLLFVSEGHKRGQGVIRYIEARYQMLFCLSDTREKLFLGRTSLVNMDALNYEWGMSLQPCLAALRALAVHQKTPTAWQPLQGRIRQKLPGLYSAPEDCEERRNPPAPKDWKQGRSVSSWNTVWGCL